MKHPKGCEAMVHEPKPPHLPLKEATPWVHNCESEFQRYHPAECANLGEARLPDLKLVRGKPLGQPVKQANLNYQVEEVMSVLVRKRGRFFRKQK